MRHDDPTPGWAWMLTIGSALSWAITAILLWAAVQYIAPMVLR